MNDCDGRSHRLTLEQISTFLAASTELERCTKVSKQARRDGTAVPDASHGYAAQITRLIGEISAAGELKKAARRRRFPMRYTDADVLLLASVDVAHQGFSRERPSAVCCSAVWRCTKILLIQRMAGIPVSDL